MPYFGDFCRNQSINANCEFLRTKKMQNMYRPKLRDLFIFLNIYFRGSLLQQKVKITLFGFLNCRSIFGYSSKNSQKNKVSPIFGDNVKDDVTPSKQIPYMSHFTIANTHGMGPKFSTLNSPQATFFFIFQVTSLQLQRKSSAKSITLALTHVSIPHMVT